MDEKSEVALKIAQQSADAAKIAYEKGLTTVGYMLELAAAQA